MGQMCMPDAGTTQDNVILPVPGPAGQNEAYSQPLHSYHQPTVKNILADTMFKISIRYTNLATRQSLPFHYNMSRYPTKDNVIIGKY